MSREALGFSESRNSGHVEEAAADRDEGTRRADSSADGGGARASGSLARLCGRGGAQASTGGGGSRESSHAALGGAARGSRAEASIGAGGSGVAAAREKNP
eukprot:3951345-Pleurochrysis_carterae.AAC.1